MATQQLIPKSVFHTEYSNIATKKLIPKFVFFTEYPKMVTFVFVSIIHGCTWCAVWPYTSESKTGRRDWGRGPGYLMNTIAQSCRQNLRPYKSSRPSGCNTCIRVQCASYSGGSSPWWRRVDDGAVSSGGPGMRSEAKTVACLLAPVPPHQVVGTDHVA